MTVMTSSRWHVAARALVAGVVVGSLATFWLSNMNPTSTPAFWHRLVLPIVIGGALALLAIIEIFTTVRRVVSLVAFLTAAFVAGLVTTSIFPAIPFPANNVQDVLAWQHRQNMYHLVYWPILIVLYTFFEWAIDLWRRKRSKLIGLTPT